VILCIFYVSLPYKREQRLNIVVFQLNIFGYTVALILLQLISAVFEVDILFSKMSFCIRILWKTSVSEWLIPKINFKSETYRTVFIAVVKPALVDSTGTWLWISLRPSIHLCMFYTLRYVWIGPGKWYLLKQFYPLKQAVFTYGVLTVCECLQQWKLAEYRCLLCVENKREA